MSVKVGLGARLSGNLAKVVQVSRRCSTVSTPADTPTMASTPTRCTKATSIRELGVFRYHAGALPRDGQHQEKRYIPTPFWENVRLARKKCMSPARCLVEWQCC